MSELKTKIIAVIQARLSSRRLRGKVLRDLCGRPMLSWVVERVMAAERVSSVIVATSADASDDDIEDFCHAGGIACFRGALDDVLDRFKQVGLAYAADHIVRITADCPLVDPELIDALVAKHLEGGADYTSNIEPLSYPDGLDAEVVRFDTLRKLAAGVDNPALREHVTAPIRARLEEYKVEGIVCEEDLSAHRWTVDTLEDFEWVAGVIEGLGGDPGGYREVLAWVRDNKRERLQSDQASAAPPALAGSGQDLYEKAKQLMPGGTQLLSKRPEMFLPGRWPAYYQCVRGCWIKDLDGRGYLDMSTNGIGSCILGAADPVVNSKVAEAIRRGSMSTLNAPEEVELAERLCEIHPWAERARFARSGGESVAIAVRTARAATGKDVVLLCGYHGWSDWYLATNLSGADGLDALLLPGLKADGVPKGLSGTAQPFHFNNLEEFKNLADKWSGRIAAVVMEPQRYHAPAEGFLETIRETVDGEGAVLVFDEITSGWRKTIGGVHLLYGVTPDIAVFGKALSNGYAMGAVIGKSSVMDYLQETFVSSTYWTERIGPTASLATLDRFVELDAPSMLEEAGKRAQAIWVEGAAKAGVPAKVGERDMVPLSHFAFDFGAAETNRAAKTLWCQEMLRHGVLDNASFYATCSHGEQEFEIYEKAVGEVFEVVAESVARGSVIDDAGELQHVGFSRLA